MSIVNRLLKELFPEKEDNAKISREVLVSEEIKRDQFFNKDYHAWVESGSHLGLLNQLNELRLRREEDPNAEDVHFFIHTEQASNGFYFHGEEPWITKDYTFVVHYFIELIKNEEYYLNHTKREVIEEGEALKTIERFYLKPSLKFRRNKPYGQLYGNILIEHRQIEEGTTLIKLIAYTYNDRSYTEPYDFNGLINILFKSDSKLF